MVLVSSQLSLPLPPSGGRTGWGSKINDDFLQYLHYLEHARHTFLRSKGIDFAGMAQKGIYLVVIRIEADYLYSLRSGDRFSVGTDLERVSRLRFGFRQEIYRLPDEKPVLRAKVIGTAVDDKGKPVLQRRLQDSSPTDKESIPFNDMPICHFSLPV